MNERETILNTIEEYGSFLIPSITTVFATTCDVTKLTSEAKKLFKENKLNWYTYFEKNSDAIILTKYKDCEYNLSDEEKNEISKKLNENGLFILYRRKKSKYKNWVDYFYYLNSLVRENKLDWHIDFGKRRYIFEKLNYNKDNYNKEEKVYLYI